ncbi:MAG: helix-turn-helix domain-containing protein [Aquirhabdus sp.]
MDKQIEQCQKDLLESAHQMKKEKAARLTQVTLSPTSEVRAKVDMSQSVFAKLLGMSVRTLQEWEQGRRKPYGAAQTLLTIAQRHHEMLQGLAA